MPTFQTLWKILTKPIFVTRNSGEPVGDPVWEGIVARTAERDARARAHSTSPGPWNSFGTTANMWIPGSWDGL